MLKIVFEGMENVVISDLEQHLPKPSYTLQTITHLQQTHPDNTCFLCIGEDGIDSFHKWHKYEEILKKVSLMVAERPGYGKERLDSSIAERSIFVDHEPVEISSSEIRQDELSFPVESAIPKEVIKYAREHNLYNY